MLNIRRFVCNMLQENTYIVSDDTREAIVIDCGAYYKEEREAIVNYIRNEQLQLVHVLCTHGHFDHCFGNDTLWHEFGVQPELSAADEFLCDIDRQMQDMMGVPYGRESAPVRHFFEPGELISFGTHQLKVLPTPGHTPGGVCFYCEEEHVVFTGDTLFRMSMGRTDFEGGSWQQMQHSLCHVLATLPEQTVAYPGHGPQTVIADEVKMNPYISQNN